MRNHYIIELTAAGLYRIRTCFPFHSTRRTGVSSTICNRKSTPTFPPDKKNLQKFAPFFAISEICPTFAPHFDQSGTIKHSESCLSGRKSHTRNVVYALRRTGGSNPSLSAKSSHFLQKKEGIPFRHSFLLFLYLLFFLRFVFNGCLSGCKTCDRYAERRATCVVHTDTRAELNGRRLTAVLTADTCAQCRTDGATFLNRHLDELTYT